MPNNLLATLLQKAITTVGSSPIVTKLLGSDPMEPDDEQFLRQFLRPQEDVLPKQDLRPTQMKDVPNIPFRKAGDHYKGIPGYLNKLSVTTKGGKPDVQRTEDGVTYPTMFAPELGHSVQSIGKDADGPYLSVYDVWDFDSPVIGGLAGQLLNKLGQPYAVYDRYPLQQDPQNPNTFKFKE